MSWLLSIVGYFTSGGLSKLIDSATAVYKAKLQASNDQDKLAADLAAKSLQLEAQEASLQAQLSGDKVGVWTRAIFTWPVALYVGKILVWDKCLHLGVTDAVDDRIWWYIQTVVIALFGYHAVAAVVSQFRARN